MNPAAVLNITGDKFPAYAASLISESILNTFRKKEFCIIALAGGSTPEPVYSKLAENQELPWEKIIFIPGDERMLNLKSGLRNMDMFYNSLLSKKNLPENNLINTNSINENSSRPAKEFSAMIENHPIIKGCSPDISILGIGSDGHTASIFPPLKNKGEKISVYVPLSPTKPVSPRISLSVNYLSGSREVFYLSKVKGKEKIIDEINNKSARSLLPAAKIKGLIKTTYLFSG